MEYMDGGTLGDLLKLRPRIPEPHIAQMARQVGREHASHSCIVPAQGANAA